jgi:hypothetical protein
MFGCNTGKTILFGRAPHTVQQTNLQRFSIGRFLARKSFWAILKTMTLGASLIKCESSISEDAVVSRASEGISRSSGLLMVAVFCSTIRRFCVFGCTGQSKDWVVSRWISFGWR